MSRTRVRLTHSRILVCRVGGTIHAPACSSHLNVLLMLLALLHHCGGGCGCGCPGCNRGVEEAEADAVGAMTVFFIAPIWSVSGAVLNTLLRGKQDRADPKVRMQSPGLSVGTARYFKSSNRTLWTSTKVWLLPMLQNISRASRCFHLLHYWFAKKHRHKSPPFKESCNYCRFCSACTSPLDIDIHLNLYLYVFCN